MLAFSIHGMRHFLEVINFVHSQSNYYNTMEFKCSRAKFSVIVTGRSPSRCITELQTMPQFFSYFFCSQPSQSTISVNDFYDTLFHMKRGGFDLMTFGLWEGSDYLRLAFFSSSGHGRCEAYLPLLLSYEELDVGVINYEIFASIDLLEFPTLSMFFNGATYATVTLSNSQVKLAGGGEEITLKQERRECIIGGVEEGDETEFVIIMKETEFFSNLKTWSNAERVWLFKSNDNFHGVIIIPVDLYAQYLVYTDEGPIG